MDNEDDYASLENVDPSEERMINEAFDEIYKNDPQLQ